MSNRAHVRGCNEQQYTTVVHEHRHIRQKQEYDLDRATDMYDMCGPN